MNKKDFKSYDVDWTPEERAKIWFEEAKAQEREDDFGVIKVITGSFGVATGIVSLLASAFAYAGIKDLEKQLDVPPSPLEEGAAIIQSVAPNTDAAKHIVKLAEEERNEPVVKIAKAKGVPTIMWSITGLFALACAGSAAAQRYYGAKSYNNSITWKMYKKHMKACQAR